MELTVFEGEQPVGTVWVTQEGLFYDVSCELTQNRERIRRVYVGQEWRSEYLGIPDASGKLRTRLPKSRLPDGIGFAVAARIPRGRWLPWRGEVDGVPIAEGYIRPSEDGIDLLLPPQEAVKLPAWTEYMRMETVFGREMMQIMLLPDGSLPDRNTDRGEQTDEETTCDDPTGCESADDAPGDGVGGEGREADCADL
ncbi:MAG: hypothetical protein IJJ99_01405 [Oscillospiraceae bacterium]|nr:hypothetical protein [Oscillospiraceae bacterium]